MLLPYKPTEPVLPVLQEVGDTYKHVENLFRGFESEIEYEELMLIINEAKERGINLDTIVIKAVDDYDGGEPELRIYCDVEEKYTAAKKKQIQNANARAFKSRMKQYEKEKELYDKRLIEYEAEMVAFRAHEEKLEKAQLKKLKAKYEKTT